MKLNPNDRCASKAVLEKMKLFEFKVLNTNIKDHVARGTLEMCKQLPLIEVELELKLHNNR